LFGAFWFARRAPACRQTPCRLLPDEIKKEITRAPLTSFRPTIEYAATEIPRFAFEKFPQAGLHAHHGYENACKANAIGPSGPGGDDKPWRIGSEIYGDDPPVARI